jgi:lysophospholipase L1-like esterase
MKAIGQIVLGCALLFLPRAHAQNVSARLSMVQELSAGRPVKIVCFGDSITGVYYHSGGRRAWCDLLGLALERGYPGTRVEMINAGVSGNTTVAALKRMEKDVLGQNPQLVVVMFGMNDVAGISPEAFQTNLTEIVQRARGKGAEVVLMTPNSVGPDDARRPPWRVAQYAEIVRRVGREMDVPVADTHRAFEAIRTVDPRAWTRLMSDPIHPNLRGHRVLAEEVAATISGRRISLESLPALQPGWPAVLARLQAGQAVKVVAMKPVDGLIGPAIKSVFHGAAIEVTPWEVDQRSLSDLEKQARDIGWLKFREHPDSQPPDLVVIAVPAGALAATVDQFYRSYTWIMNWSLAVGKSTGKPGWDCLVVLPSVAQPAQDQGQQAAESLALDVVLGQDLPWLQRAPGDTRPAAELLAQKLNSLLRLKEN